MKRSSPSTARNRDAIRDVIAPALPAGGTVLEIASGTGEHAVHFARAFPHLAWQPTDVDDEALASIEAWRTSEELANVRPARRLDVHDAVWPAANAITCINMIHISPWSATQALFAGAARTLAPGEVLITYGPYRIDGVTAPSNEQFDRSLKGRDARWGVRELAELRAVATGFTLEAITPMPANNHTLVFRRS